MVSVERCPELALNDVLSLSKDGVEGLTEGGISRLSYHLVISLAGGRWLVPSDGKADLNDRAAVATFRKSFILKLWAIPEAQRLIRTTPDSWLSQEFWSLLCAIPEVQALMREFGGGFVPSKEVSNDKAA